MDILKQFPAPWYFSGGLLVCRVGSRERTVASVRDFLPHEVINYMVGCVNAMALGHARSCMRDQEPDGRRFAIAISPKRDAELVVPLRMTTPECKRLQAELKRVIDTLDVTTVTEEEPDKQVAIVANVPE